MSKAILLSGKAVEAVAAIAAAIESKELSLDDLKSLHEAEAAGDKRQSVLAALAKAIDTATTNNPPLDAGETNPPPPDESENTPPPTDQAPPTTGKAARGEKPAEAPAWTKPDYSGPLTCDQAEWRLANIKVKTK